MVDVPDMNFISGRFSNGLSGARTAYEEGVSRRSDSFWQEQTAAARDAWVDGVQESINNNTWEEGVNNPIRSWSERSASVGAQRIGQDSEGAAQAYSTAFAPYRDAIESASLSPRGARGSPQNYQRSEELGQELHQLSLNR